MNTEAANELFYKASKLEDSGNLEPALVIRRQLAAEFPKNKLLLLTLADSLKKLNHLEEAEVYYKKTVKLAPKWELASLHLFHFYWDKDGILDSDCKDEAFDEMRRFQSISHCEDYVEIVRGINENNQG